MVSSYSFLPIYYPEKKGCLLLDGEIVCCWGLPEQGPLLYHLDWVLFGRSRAGAPFRRGPLGQI